MARKATARTAKDSTPGNSSVTPLNSLPVVAAYNQRTAPTAQTLVVNFPAAGAYPFELDYASGGGPKLTLVMSTDAGPVPPATTLLLTPVSVGTMKGGQLETFTITAVNSDGSVASNLPITLTIAGYNSQIRNATTGSQGTASITYQGIPGIGVDTVQASAQINNATLVSNAVTVPWNNTTTNVSPVVQVTPSNVTTVVGGHAPLNGTVTDDGLPSDNLTIAWSVVSGPGTVTFDNAAQATTGATFTNPGNYVLQLSASDGALITTVQVPVTVQQNLQWSDGWLALPNQSTVNGIVPINLVQGVTLASGTLSYYPASNLNDVHVLNANTIGTGRIGTFDTTLLANGSYWIELYATNSSGTTQNNLALLIVTGDYKPGRVTATVKDLVVPADGLAIRVDRVYDSLNSGQVGDFGNGWNLSLNVDLELDPANNVMFTLGNRRRSFTVSAWTTWLGSQLWWIPSYTPEPGEYGTLKTTGDNCDGVVLVNGNTLVCAVENYGALYRPAGFIYTDPLGTQYTMGTDGSLQSVQDMNGNTLAITSAGITSNSGITVPFVRDSQGRITQITDPLGNRYQYGYDANGNLASVTYPTTATPAQYTYNGDHLMVQETDRRGYVAGSGTYDANGRIQSQTDAVGNTTYFAYDTATNTTTVTNADGGTVVTVLDSYGDVLSVTDPLNHTTTYTYDANRDMLTKTDPLGNVWTYTYDTNGNQTSAKDPLGNISQTQYNSYSGPTRITDALGNSQALVYDSNFRPLAMSDSIGQSAAATYDAAGNFATLVDANGNTSQYAHDLQGDLLSTTDPLGNVTSSTYNQLGNRLTSTDALGNKTSYTYDAAGRPTGTTYADGSTNSTVYDGNGNVSSRTDALGRITSYTYDAEDRLTQTSYPDGTTTATTYNWRGQTLTTTDQAGHITVNVYDLAGRLTQTTTASGTSDAATTHFSYDAAGRKITSTDPRGNVTAYTYDNAGRTVKVTDALGDSTSFTYDADGRQTVVTDPLERKTQYAYDTRSRVTTTTYPDETTTGSTYDGVGHVTAATDQAGQITHYAFDAVGRLTSVTDALNEITQYAYDANGNTVSRTDANGHSTSYTYDVLNRIKTRTLPAGGAPETFGYNPTGTLASVTDFNLKTTTFGYDPLDRLLSRTPDPSFNEPATVFTYKPTGQRATMADASGTTAYGYDNQNRLLTKATPFGTLSYTYDAAGNRLSMLSS
ncbi:MAG: DUF6531 domain-containing protein, partial [Bryobacteraceae bacterium]